MVLSHATIQSLNSTVDMLLFPFHYNCHQLHLQSFVGKSTTNEHADSLSEIGTNTPPTKNSGAKIKHAGGKLLKK